MLELEKGLIVAKKLRNPSPEIRAYLSSSGIILSSMDGVGNDISAVTNSVYRAQIGSPENMTSLIVKISERLEPREISLSSSLGGWTPNKLENEAKILCLVNGTGISSPKPIFYQGFSGGQEVMGESVIDGEKCVNLRIPEVSHAEFAKLEFEKGKLLAKISQIPLADKKFGTLDTGAVRFETWSDYYYTKVATTLSILYGVYGNLKNLQYFGDIATNESQWKEFVENTAKLFSGGSIQKLIEKDGKPTLSHGDFWDGNLMARKNLDKWEVSVIDFERGGIEGRSFDLSLWLAWKVGGKPGNPDPIKSSEDFLKGYVETGGNISLDIEKYIVIYGLWQYLDFLVMDVIYGIDRTDESAPEIKKYSAKLLEL
jgi:hypothetical protein